jgi:DnaK suppressor protein
MNSEQLEHFRQLLLSWRSDLVNEVSKTVGHMKDEAANFPDPADRATQEEEFSLELRARDRERKLIKKIDGTLERISIDDYGYCDACGIEIGVQRLEARPTATLCIDCKHSRKSRSAKNWVELSKSWVRYIQDDSLHLLRGHSTLGP